VTSIYDEALAPAGVNAAQFALLRRLGESSPLSISQLADRTELERSTVARNVRVLEKRRLVELGGLPGDRRTTAIRLSDRGRRALRDGGPLWETAQRRFEELLGAGRASELRKTLHSL
jgi:DNA-binding MarR family transcriptional regulator